MFEQHNKGHEGAFAPVVFETTNDAYKGTIWVSKTEQLHYVVLEYRSKYDVVVQCLELGNIQHVYLAALRAGAIKNPYYKGKYGGYFGEGPYTKAGHRKAYNVWKNMITRVTEEGQMTSRNAKYVGVIVDERWYNYQVFADWYERYMLRLNPKYHDEYQIDKDILTYYSDIKMYSPETCCLVPEAINKALDGLYRNRIAESDLPMGVHSNGKTFSVNISIYGKQPYLGVFNSPEEAFICYKTEKEKYIKELADFYYSENAILKDVYDALYAIEIYPYKLK